MSGPTPAETFEFCSKILEQNELYVEASLFRKAVSKARRYPERYTQHAEKLLESIAMGIAYRVLERQGATS
jgi:hypothetical protein